MKTVIKNSYYKITRMYEYKSNCVDKSPSLEADSYSVVKKFPTFYRTRKISTMFAREAV